MPCSMETPRHKQEQGQEQEQDCTWTVHPARMNPRRALLGLLVILISAFAIATWIEPPSWRLPIGLAVAGVLFLSVNRFFLPSTFKIDDDGITASYPLRSMRLQWKDLRRFLVGEHGGLLSRRARSSSMDVFTGMQLFFDEQRDARVELIHSLMNRKDAKA